MGAQRVGVFVDVQQMYYSARAVFEGKLNYGSFLDFVLGKRQLVRATAYVTTKDEVDQKAFLGALAKFGYLTKVKKMKIMEREGVTKTKGSWNVGMVVDAIQLAPKLDVICICSGDGDLSSAIPMLKSLGCVVEIFSFEGTLSSELRQHVDKCTSIPKDLILCEKQNSSSPLGNTSSGNIDKLGLPDEDEEEEGEEEGEEEVDWNEEEEGNKK